MQDVTTRGKWVIQNPSVLSLITDYGSIIISKYKVKFEKGKFLLYVLLVVLLVGWYVHR